MLTEEIIAAAATPLGFAELVLGLPLYEWQDRALAPLERLVDETDRATRRVKITVATPNGAGKSERIVAAAALYWISVHARGRVVITTKDGRQLSEQIYPALTRHRPKFPGWQWVTSPHIRISTPTGGVINAFTTDDPGRAEGWHMDFDPAAGNVDGPLLIIVDEAKSVPERIFEALDRCGANVFLYCSSPGVRAGRFYDSHTRLKDDFVVVRAGLKDCPHIPAAKIADIVRTHGEDAPFTRSVLYGEFMDSTTRQRFDRDGLATLREMAEGCREWHDGLLVPQEGGSGRGVSLQGTERNAVMAWLRWWEEPIAGCRYLIVCDAATGAEQQRGAANPDRHAVLVLRASYQDRFNLIHRPAVVARIIPPCHVAHEVLADRLALLSRWLGNCVVAVEANHPGPAILALLQARNVPLYRRAEGKPEKPDFKPGFLTTSASKPLIVAKLAEIIREEPPGLDVWCPHLVAELSGFVTLPDGREAAEEGLHDDDAMALCIAWHCLKSGTVFRLDRPTADAGAWGHRSGRSPGATS